MIPLGISVAATTRVGNHLGANSSGAAVRSCFAAMLLSEGLAVAYSTGWLLIRRWWPAAFTTDPTVIDLTARLLVVTAVSQLFDGLQTTMGGVLRGVGLQAWGAAINLFSQWVVGLPLGLWLGLKGGWGALGLWAGIGVGAAAMVPLQCCVLACVDWKKMAAEAHAQAAASGVGAPLTEVVGPDCAKPEGYQTFDGCS